MPESIGSVDSPFNVGELIDSVLAEASYFGSTREEQSQSRKDHYEELVDILMNERRFRNSYLQNFIKSGIQDFEFAQFTDDLDGEE